MTPEEALALPRPGRPRPGCCPGYAGENRPFDKHHLVRLPLVPHPMGNGGNFATGIRRFAGIADGRTCSTCWGVYDPTPMCEQVVDYDAIWGRGSLCGSVAVCREPGVIEYSAARRAREHDGATVEHAFCAKHAPSRMRAREQGRDDRYAATQAAKAAQRAPYVERAEAEAALVAEALCWRDDEAATGEGFCDEDCEHHECRLARAVTRYEAAAAVIPIPAWARYRN